MTTLKTLWAALTAIPRMLIAGDTLAFLAVSLLTAVVRLAVVGALLIGHPASAMFTTLFKDFAHIWIGTLLGFWHAEANHNDIDAPFYKFWFWALCWLEILAAITTVTYKLVQGIPLG